MSTQPIPNDPSDDELETLAQDLLGVDLSSVQPKVEPFEVEEFDLEIECEEADSAPSKPQIADVGEVAAAEDDWRPSLPYGEDDEFSEDDFGSSILDPDEEPLTADAQAVDEQAVDDQAVDERAVDEQAVDDQTVETVVGDDEAAAAIDAETVVDDDDDDAAPIDAEDVEDFDDDLDDSDSAEDTYWDALDGWDWDDDPETKPKRSTASDSAARSTAREADRADESAPKTSELRDDKEFGAGLEVDGSGSTDEEESQERGSRPRTRRRRRRTAKRSELTASDVPAGDRDADESSTRELEDVDDGFGAGLIADDAKDQPRRRSRPGRRRRRRRTAEPASQETHADSEPVRAAGDPTSEDADSDEGDVESAEESAATCSQERRYRNIPTWEQAISFLVRPAGRRTGSGSATSEGRKQSGSGKSGSRRGGGRRGGRRSSGS